MLQFKPGRDVAMLSAMLHTIIFEDLYDKQYVQAHTEDFDELKESLKDRTPEAMAAICGIDADTLRTVARKYARAESAIIFWGMGISQHVHGTDNARCLIALAMVTGQVGRPGTGLHPLRGQNNVQGASDAGLIPMFFPDYRPVESPEMRAIYRGYLGRGRGAEARPHRGRDHGPRSTPARSAACTSWARIRRCRTPTSSHAREALAKLDHLVVQDLFLTETARYADVVLPASAWPEKSGTVTNTNRQVQMGRIALPLPGETRQDLWIIQEIARRIGLDWHYAGPADVFAEMKRGMPSLDNITWDRAGAREFGDLSVRCRGQAGQRHRLRRRLPDQDRPRQTRAGGPRAARRGARCRLSDGADDRPPARALAYRRHDAAR